MPFGVVSRVGREMGVLDGVEIVEGETAVLGVNVGGSSSNFYLLAHRLCDPPIYFGMPVRRMNVVYTDFAFCPRIGYHSNVP